MLKKRIKNKILKVAEMHNLSVQVDRLKYLGKEEGNQTFEQGNYEVILWINEDLSLGITIYNRFSDRYHYDDGTTETGGDD